ncbi:MAG: FtsX-like permease family protein [Desulfuromonadales bacterium]|nr:FtsX-like permease family protein [Desulfuromonadales bacterium]
MYILKIIIRNTLRHRLRTGLTILGITIAILAFGLLRTIVGLWNVGVERSVATRLITRNAISLVFSLPISYLDRIRQISGVKGVSYGNWFGGIYIDEKYFFASEAIEPQSFLDLYPEFILPPEEKTAFIRDRKGCIVGRRLAARYGWKTGDLITLKGTIFPGQWEFVLRGIFTGAEKNTEERMLFFNWAYLNESLKKTTSRRADQAGFYMIGINRADDAAQVSQDVDRMFKNSLAETLTETEKAFQLGFASMTEAIMVAIQIVSYLVIVIIMAVVANTMAMTARERIGEYAIFKAMGFRGRHIAGMVFGESLLITMTGCLMGILLTFPVGSLFSGMLGDYFPVFEVKRSTLYLDITFALLVGCIAGIIPTLRAVRIRIADGLRRIG